MYFRRETIVREQEARRAWSAKFDPWLIDEYRQVRWASDAGGRSPTPWIIENRCTIISQKIAVWLVTTVSFLSNEPNGNSLPIPFHLYTNVWQVSDADACSARFPKRRMTWVTHQDLLRHYPLFVFLRARNRTSVGVFCLNKPSKPMEVVKRWLACRYQVDIAFLIGLPKVFINSIKRFCSLASVNNVHINH